MEEKIDTLLKVGRVFHPTAQTKARAYIQDYEAEYRKSIAGCPATYKCCGGSRRVERSSSWTHGTAMG